MSLSVCLGFNPWSVLRMVSLMLCSRWTTDTIGQSGCVKEHICPSFKQQASWQREMPEFQTGDQVWLSTRDLKLRLPNRKLSPRFVGRFEILSRVNPVCYKLKLPPQMPPVFPVFNVSLLDGGEVEPTLPVVIEVEGVPAYWVIPGLLEETGSSGVPGDCERYSPDERSCSRTGEVCMTMPPEVLSHLCDVLSQVLSHLCDVMFCCVWAWCWGNQGVESV